MSRRPLISTEAGSRLEAFGPAEWALLSSVALIWGSSFLFIEVALEVFSPGMITWGRIALGWLTLAFFPIVRRRVDRSDWPRIIVLSFTWVSIPFLLFPIAQQHINSALSGMLNALVPIYAAVIAAVLLRARPRSVQVAGIGIGFLGALAISLPAINESSSSGFGVLLVVIATAFYGLSINLAVPLQHAYGAPAVMFRALGLATVATAPFGLGTIGSLDVELGPLLALLALGLIGTGLPFVLMAAFVGRVGPTRGGVAVYFIPIVSIILGVVFLSEKVVAAQIVGTGLVMLGAWLTSRREG